MVGESFVSAPHRLGASDSWCLVNADDGDPAVHPRRCGELRRHVRVGDGVEPRFEEWTTLDLQASCFKEPSLVGVRDLKREASISIDENGDQHSPEDPW